MIRRRKSDDPLAPPSRSPKTDTVPIGSTKEHARPSIGMYMYFKKKFSLIQGPHCTGKTGKIVKKDSSQGNTGNLEFLPKPRENPGKNNCSSCKFPGSKDSGYCDICCKIFQFFKVISLYEILAYFFFFFFFFNCLFLNMLRVELWGSAITVYMNNKHIYIITHKSFPLLSIIQYQFSKSLYARKFFDTVREN